MMHWIGCPVLSFVICDVYCTYETDQALMAIVLVCLNFVMVVIYLIMFSTTGYQLGTTID